jgi:ABC-type transport system involved in resistance to organic solvents, permease component
VNSAPLHPPTWTLGRRGSGSDLQLAGDWIAHLTGLRKATEARSVVDQAGSGSLRIDCRELGRWDSALVVFLRMVQGQAAAKGVRIDDEGLPQAARQLLALGARPDATTTVDRPPRGKSLALRVGERFLRGCSETGTTVALVGDTALRGTVALAGRARTRAVDVLLLMKESGPGALVIVAIVNGLVGAILAFVGAVQFRKFGAGIYVADLVGIAVVREMAAVMTAIVMAGRTGGAYAAHIATMQGNEEIDALKTFGIPPFDFLVLPRIVALVTMMPLLYLYGCAVGLLGGYVVGVTTLDVTSSAFLVELQDAVAGRQFAIGAIKSVTFGALVALAGCSIGLRAGRSAAGVGRAATSAVVAGIIGVIALDAVFAACTNALGI